MLLTIHNLPSNTRYVDVKSMLQEKCGLSELILDNLVSEGATKRVTVGLADEGDAGILARKINGLYVNGLQLYVEDKRKKKDSDQPYRSSASIAQDTRYQEPVDPHNMMGDTMVASVNNAMMMNYNMAGMYMPMPVMPMEQNMSYVGYGDGFMVTPAVEARPEPAPPRGPRDFPAFRGDGGLADDWPRDRAREEPRPREPARGAARSRGRNRRPSPDRPAEVFKRPSRWNEPNQGDVLPRKEPSPPRQPWPAREPSRAPGPPPRQAARDREPLPPRQQPAGGRQAEPQWEPSPSRWDDDRAAQPRDRPWPSEPAARWEPEPDQRWEPEPDRSREPRRDRGRQPEPDRAGDEPYHVMESAEDRQFDDWEDGPQAGPAGGYPRSERFEPGAPRFDEGYPPVHHDRPEFPGRGRDQPPDRERRPDRDADWNAGNGNRGRNRAATGSARADRQPWARPEDRQRPAPPKRQGRDDLEPQPSGSNFRNGSDWRDDKRPNPSKRGLSDRQRGTQGFNQIAGDHPPFKKPRAEFDKRAVEQRSNKFTPQDNENRRRMPFQRAPERPQRAPLPTAVDVTQKPITMTYIINKDQTSRGQATAKLAREATLVNGRLRDAHHIAFPILKELKQCIRSRIDVMLGEELLSGHEEIISRYRLKYPAKNDNVLYQCMKDKVSQRSKEQGNEANMAAVKIEKSETQVKEEPDDNANKPLKTAANKDDKKPKDEPKPPKQGLTVKQVIREEKLQRKLEFTKEDHYKLDPVTDKMVDVELENVTDIFASECENPDDPTEQTICNHIKKESLNEFKKVTRLHLAKRILNIRSGLAVRIFSVAGKLPRRGSVVEYLKPYMIAGLDVKKNKKGSMYVANIDNFEHYDHLCNLQNDVIDGIPVTIKNMNLVGPPRKWTKNEIRLRRQQFINSQIEPRDSPVVPTETQIKPTETQIEPTENQIEPIKNQILPIVKKNDPTGKQIEPTENLIKSTSQRAKIEETKDPMNNLNAESMEDFTADDFDGMDFAVHKADGEDFAAEHSAEDPNIGDAEELNIADIKEEDLEDF